MAYKDLNDEQLEGLVLLDLPDEQLAEIYIELGVRQVKLALGMNERCYQRFGKKILSDTQETIFRKMADGILPTDDELKTLDDFQILESMFVEEN